MCAILVAIATWFLVRSWYFRLVFDVRRKIYNLDGKTVPGQTPKMLVGNIPDVYRAKNRLTSYNSFHKKFGEIVQIFWLWRQQISISNYHMARQIFSC